LEREHPELVRVVRVGLSGEGRDVLGVEVGREVGDDERGREKKLGKKGRREKMGFVISGAQHAREVSS
jgi:extracellular matrix protein 14